MRWDTSRGSRASTHEASRADEIGSRFSGHSDDGDVETAEFCWSQVHGPGACWCVGQLMASPGEACMYVRQRRAQSGHTPSSLH